MHPDDPRNYLPDAIRESKLPWEPMFGDQAAAPRDGDGWDALLGHLRVRLSISWTPDDPLPEFELCLENTITEREISSWCLERLDVAVQVAESVHQLRLDELLHAVRGEAQRHAA